MASLGIGIIGYGGFGRFLQGAWGAMEGAQVVAVADERVGLDTAGAVHYRHWRDLLADERVEMVSVATPPHLHAEMGCAAMEAGRHVLVEKPLALTLDGARRLIETRDRTGRVAGVNFMLRFNPVVEAIHAWCRSGAFGRLRRVVVENYAQDEALSPEHWFWDSERSGGILVEHSVHFIDLVRSALGQPATHVAGVRQERPSGQEDRVLLDVVFQDGLVMTQYHSFARPASFERTTLHFSFDLADVEVEGWIPMSGRVRALVGEASREALTLLPGLSFTREMPLATTTASAGGEPFGVQAQIEAAFALPASKSELYAGALRRMMEDLIATLRVPGHRQRVTLEDGYESLRIARAATDTALRQRI